MRKKKQIARSVETLGAQKARFAWDDKVFLGRKWRVASGEENKEQERFLAAWADILAGAMMKEKAPAHFARNDGRREGGCRGMEEGTMCCVSTREQDGHIAGAMMKEKAPARFARNDVRREGGCRGMEEGTMCCVSTREQDGHDVSCPYKSREKRGAGKIGDGKNRRTSRGLLAWQWRGEFRVKHLADKFWLKSMDY